ncbi:MAG: carboxypeptidase regulatory-like domain-containing protein [Acidobacteria bacterium]|nr:carboxypeptidase regulatory-like domain-containing protein [Acidobacteriota bacterium]
MIRVLFLCAAVELGAADVRVFVEVRELGTTAPVPWPQVNVGSRPVRGDYAGRAMVDIRTRDATVPVSASAAEFMAIDGVQELPVPNDSPSMAVRIYLARKKTVTGTLLDPSSEMPLQGYQVRLLRETKYRGERIFVPMEAAAVTGRDGRFALNGFLPASFALRISSAEILVREGSADEALPERTGRAVAYWPGIRSEEPDRAIAISHAFEQVVGKVYAAEVPLHAVASSIEGRSCSDSYDVSVYRRKEMVRERLARSQIACGRGFVVENLPEGEYVFEAVRQGFEIASRSLHVARNEHIKLLARPGFWADVGFAVDKTSGRVFAKLAYSDAARVELRQSPRIWMWPDEPYEFEVLGLAPGYFFESILLPETRVAAGDVVRLSGVTKRSVQLVIAKPAALMAGKVSNARGEPVSAMIEAVREGATRERKRAMAGRDEKFSLRGLAPGRYRVFAADAEELGVFVEAKAGEPAWVEVRR